jgi:hypothetical protein
MWVISVVFVDVTNEIGQQTDVVWVNTFIWGSSQLIYEKLVNLGQYGAYFCKEKWKK